MREQCIIPAPVAAQPTVYLCTSGVLHPSESTYELVRGRSPWLDGHVRYEGVPVLEAALAKFPDVKLVMTTPEPKAYWLQSVLRDMGPFLADRVVGFSFEDLTVKIKREVRTRSGTTRLLGYSSQDYWRMSKAEIVAAHVAWSRPERWIVIDAEDILWPTDVRRDRLVLTDGCEGLLGAYAQDRLMTVMLMNFEATMGASPEAGVATCHQMRGKAPEVESSPDVMGGTPVFVGSRLPISTLLACADAGEPWGRVLDSWPWLTPEHLDVARAWQKQHPGIDVLPRKFRRRSP